MLGDCYLGEIRLFTYSDGEVPEGWHVCDGTIYPIQANVGLYAFIQNTFGGELGKTFALPDLRGRVPMGYSPTANPPIAAGVKGGAEEVTLTVAQMPIHNHLLIAEQNPGHLPLPPATPPGASHLASAGADGQGHIQKIAAPPDATPDPELLFDATTLSVTGGAAHNNLQPSLVMNYCIALSGLTPSPPDDPSSQPA